MDEPDASDFPDFESLLPTPTPTPRGLAHVRSVKVPGGIEVTVFVPDGMPNAYGSMSSC